MTHSQTAAPARRSTGIKLHSREDFAAMRRAGNLAARVLDYITPHVQPGVSTEELDRLCHDFIIAHGAIPAPLNYRGFPKSICTSVNHVVCHGIPGEKRATASISMSPSSSTAGTAIRAACSSSVVRR